MVQPGKNPSPGEPFHDPNASERSDPGLEGVVEELRNVLSGLGEDTVKKTVPADEQLPASSESPFPFSPVAEPLEDTLAVPGSERGPLQETPQPSDADFWNGNVLGWADKAPDAAVPESFSEPEPEPVKPARKSVGDLLPPLPASPFDVGNNRPAPLPEPKVVNIVVPLPTPEPPAPIVEPFVEHEPPAPQIAPPVPEEKPAMVEVQMDKPEGLIQIACIYPKGFEKQGQQFVTTLRGACVAAKLKIIIQPVYIQPWSMEAINVSAWATSAQQAGADRMFVMAPKKEQDKFKNVASEAAVVGMASRLILMEHVSLRTLYADILVELRRV